MEIAGGKKERRRHPRFFVDLPFEYQVGDDPCLKGGIVVNASEGGLLIESVKVIPIGTRLVASVLFPRGFELADLKLAAVIARKEPLFKEEWEGFQYGLNIVRLPDEDHSKLKMVLTGRFSLEAIDTYFEEVRELKRLKRDEERGPGLRVLVVDDEEGIRKLLVNFLSQRGHRCLQAVDGVDALGIAMTNGIDAIITDIAMPKMDGITLAKELFKRIPRLPIMVMTGGSTDFSSLTTMASGARECIKKPFSLTEFAVRFDKMMKDQPIRRENATERQSWIR